jgi:hypothetical protein
VLDSTVTPMGGRLLRRWLHRPLRDRGVVGQRHHAVSALIDARAGELLRDAFRSLGDLERILSRVALRSARPRDLSTLRDGLSLLPSVQQILSGLDSPRLQALHAALGEHEATARMLRAAIVPQPPLLARDGGAIADGYDAELDELRQLSTNADQFLVELEAREREASGIATLKVGYNRVHGYYIEISKGQSDQGAGALHAPADADRSRALHHRGTEGLRGQGAVRARTLAVAREAAVRRRARPAQRGLEPLRALRRRAERTRRAGRLRRARAGAGLGACRCSATSPASRSSAAAIRWSRRCATHRSSPTTCASMARPACW